MNDIGGRKDTGVSVGLVSNSGFALRPFSPLNWESGFANSPILTLEERTVVIPPLQSLYRLWLIAVESLVSVLVQKSVGQPPGPRRWNKRLG